MNIEDRPIEELTDDQVEEAMERAMWSTVCAKCGGDLRPRRGRYSPSFGQWEHVKPTRGHKPVPA